MELTKEVLQLLETKNELMTFKKRKVNPHGTYFVLNEDPFAYYWSLIE